MTDITLFKRNNEIDITKFWKRTVEGSVYVVCFGNVAVSGPVWRNGNVGSRRDRKRDIFWIVNLARLFQCEKYFTQKKIKK